MICKEGKIGDSVAHNISLFAKHAASLPGSTPTTCIEYDNLKIAIKSVDKIVFAIISDNEL